MFFCFISCIGLSYFLLKLIRTNNISEEILRRMEDTYDKRIKSSEDFEKIYGRQSKVNKLTKIDIDLEMSGLRIKFPSLNTEVLLLILAVILIVTLMLSYVIWSSLLITCASVLVVCYFIKLFFIILIEKNIKAIDDGLIQFANQLYSYSNASNDIITIMSYSVPYLSEPLHSAIQGCVQEVRISGDLDLAFSRLNMKLKHRQLNMLLENLAESSKNNANYKEIIQRAHETIITYVADKEERRANAKVGIMTIGLMLAILLWAIYILVKTFLKQSLSQFFLGSLGGKWIFASLLVVIFFTLWKCINMGKEV